MSNYFVSQNLHCVLIFHILYFKTFVCLPKMDLTKFFESLNDPEVAKYIGILPPSPTLAHEKTKWNWHENKLFENALGEYDNLDDLDTELRVFEDIASKIPGKTVDDIKQHYKDLVEDIELIESGDISLPNCNRTDCDDEEIKLTTKNKSSKKIIKRKPKPWSQDEHEFVFSILHRFFIN